jgi:glycerophosphoryl diester phosphodiesterase
LVVTYGQLQGIWLDKKAMYSTLEEAFKCIDKKCAVNIEIKSSDVAELVILIERFILSQNNGHTTIFLVSSFEWNNWNR